LNSIFDLIPKDKYDNSGIEMLKTIVVDEAEPILRELLEWIQDINWPVARELMDVLPRFHNCLIQHIKAVFNSDDEEWKCWVLYLLNKFPVETIEILKYDIKRMAESPTENEKSSKVNSYAFDVMRTLNIE
jgi:hypothetical protein